MMVGGSNAAKPATCVKAGSACNNLFRMAKVKKLNHLQALTIIKFKNILLIRKITTIPRIDYIVEKFLT